MEGCYTGLHLMVDMGECYCKFKLKDMEKKIEDYLHLYMGQKCMTRLNFEKELRESDVDIRLFTAFDPKCNWAGLPYRYVEVKPILRPLSDMTEDESLHLGKYPMAYDIQQSWYTPKQFTYLLKQGFDLFGLIDAGLAINKLNQLENK